MEKDYDVTDALFAALNNTCEQAGQGYTPTVEMGAVTEYRDNAGMNISMASTAMESEVASVSTTPAVVLQDSGPAFKEKAAEDATSNVGTGISMASLAMENSLTKASKITNLRAKLIAQGRPLQFKPTDRANIASKPMDSSNPTLATSPFVGKQPPPGPAFNSNGVSMRSGLSTRPTSSTPSNSELAPLVQRPAGPLLAVPWPFGSNSLGLDATPANTTSNTSSSVKCEPLPARPIPSIMSQPHFRTPEMAKGSCHKCGFVHRGHLCERHCISCGTIDPKQHSLKCVYLKAHTKGRSSPEPLVKKFEGERDKLLAVRALSSACQKRGFNPLFHLKPFGNDRFTCSVELRDLVFHGDGDHATLSLAKSSAARPALEFLENHPRASCWGELGPRPMDPPAWRNDVKRLIASVEARDYRSKPVIKPEPSPPVSHGGEFRRGRNNDVELPANVEPRAVRGIVEQVLSSNNQTGGSVTLNLPGNVSVEVAEAYGRALANFKQQDVRRRSRSRSPQHSALSYRDRNEGDRYRYINRPDLHPVKDIDHYRPSRRNREPVISARGAPSGRLSPYSPPSICYRTRS